MSVSHDPVGLTRSTWTGTGARPLWAQLPEGAAQAFLPHVRPMAQHILRDIRAAMPEYTACGPPESATVDEISTAVFHCLADVGPAGADDHVTEWRRRFTDLGRIAYVQGRSLESLQSAYRVGGRSSWRYLSGFMRSIPLSPEQLCIGAEAVFATVDDIATLSAEGYADARIAGADSREQQRSRLLQLMLSEPPATDAAVAALAAAAGWDMPDQVVVVALETPVGAGAEIQLDGPVLRVLDGPRPCLVAGDAAAHLQRLDVRLGGRRAAISPSVPVSQAGPALRCARRALELQVRGLLPASPVLDCTEHLTTMWLAAEPFLVARLTETALEPLRALAPRQRRRMADTLLGWLRHCGNTVEVAGGLGVHPQTVRYRMNQLREMFGDRLDDPGMRLAMEMALSALELVGPHAGSWPAGTAESALAEFLGG